MGARLAASFVTLVLVSVVAFFAIESAPGDAVTLAAGGLEMSPEALAHRRADLGLDRPAWQRYGRWMSHALAGDLGVSFRTNRPVAAELLARVPVTATIALFASVLAALVAVVLGVTSAAGEGRMPDRVVRAAAAAVQSVPAFLVALAALYVFGFRLAWAPLYGIAGGRGLIVPVLTIASALGLSLSRVVRNALLEATHREYYLAALGKGLTPGRALVCHALPNALTPLVSVMAMRVTGLLGGLVLVESLFGLPGLGSYLLEAVSGRDYPVVQGYLLFTSTLVVLTNLGADLTVRWLDPRAARARMS
jgi:ABC-type dipeptide/oligopeptide/nickel transport system permease component